MSSTSQGINDYKEVWTMNITEELNTPVRYTCDVLVVGGGVAGIASALSATREGKSVMLIERSFMLGGLATAGLITIYLPICDGYGHQVCYGIAEELLKLSISIEKPMTRGMVNWVLNNDSELRNENTPRYQVDFNPYLFAISAEQLLIKNNKRFQSGQDYQTEEQRGAFYTRKDKKGQTVELIMLYAEPEKNLFTIINLTGDIDEEFLCFLYNNKTFKN